ncbi:MAG: AMP-dependent synthetase, partial [Acidimicrobiia bacterium]
VELELKRHPNIEHVIVMGLPDDEWGSVVVAFYVGSAGSSQLEGWLRQRVPVHMIPKRWISLDVIPTTQLGKPDRTALLGLLADGQG